MVKTLAVLNLVLMPMVPSQWKDFDLTQTFVDYAFAPKKLKNLGQSLLNCQ